MADIFFDYTYLFFLLGQPDAPNDSNDTPHSQVLVDGSNLQFLYDIFFVSKYTYISESIGVKRSFG